MPQVKAWGVFIFDTFPLMGIEGVH